MLRKDPVRDKAAKRLAHRAASLALGGLAWERSGVPIAAPERYDARVVDRKYGELQIVHLSPSRV